MVTQEDLQELMAVNGGSQNIVSLYLNVDVTQETSETLRKQVRALLKDSDCPQPDVKAIENYLDFSHDWGKPGLAIFSCSELDFFRAFPTAIPFRNRIRMARKPHVKPLTHLLENYAHFGVIVVDKIGASFYEYHLGELQSTGSTTGEDVRKLKLGGGSARGGGTTSSTGQRGGQGGRHEEEVVLRNLRQAASAASQFYKTRPIRRLFLGGTSETIAQFREYLPKKLQSQIAGSFAVDKATNEHEIRQRSLELMIDANSRRENLLVDEMITAAAKGGNAVTGLDATLRTLNEGRVQTLIVSDGFRIPGYYHQGTNYLLAHKGDPMPFSDEKPTEVEDVVDVAVHRTMELGGRVEIISENPQLEEAGRIGALLRY